MARELEGVVVAARASALTCAFCRDAVGDEHETWRCSSCATLHHRECAREHGRCSVFGCVERVREDPWDGWRFVREGTSVPTDGLTPTTRRWLIVVLITIALFYVFALYMIARSRPTLQNVLYEAGESSRSESE